MHDIAALTLTASRMLNYLFLHGEERWNALPKTAQMPLIGAKSATAFREARMQLEQEGFLTITRHPGKDSSISLRVHCTFLSSAGGVGWGSGVDEVGLDNVYIYNILEGSSIGSTSDVSNGYSHLDGSTGTPIPIYPLHSNGSTGTPIEMVVPDEGYSYSNGSTTAMGVRSLIERCREVDEMDESGAPTSTKSPFGVRRLAQIPLVQEAYKQYFPQDTHDLNPINAKTWLSLTSNRSEDVVDRLADIAQRKPEGVPLLYITKVFRGEAQRESVPQKVQSPMRSSASTTSSAYADGPAPTRGQERRPSVSVLERPKVGAGAYIPGGDLPPASPEYLEALKESNERFERMKREKGWAE